MRRDLIEVLHCPYSGTRFSVSNVLGESDAGLDYAIITSEAGDFPVVDGIFRLKIDEHRFPLVNLIKNKKPEEALLTALEAPSYGRRSAAVNFLDRTANRMGFGAQGVKSLKRPLYRALTDATASLSQTVNRLNSQSWANWQIYRFSMPAFLPVYPLLHLIRDEGPVLDFGCGLGQASFLISRKIESSRITCVDHQFSLLFLARKFFVSKSNFVCLDGNYPLPFGSAYFSTVFSSDVVHLIDSKVGLTQEFRRILSGKGAIILPHLHNKLSPVQFGKSLTPEGYGNLFAGMEKRIAPEDWIVDRFITSDSLDLEKQWTREELNAAIKGLSIVASNDSSFFQHFTGLWKNLAGQMTNPIVNPLYHVSGQAGRWELRKEAPDSGAKFSAGSEGYLPNKAHLALPSLDHKAILSLKNSDPLTFGELARKFILIDVPERFP